MRPVNITYLLIYFCLFSCSQKGDVIKDTSLIEIYFRDGDTVYKHQDTSKKIVKDFIKVFNGKQEKRICPTEGEIRFYSKDTLLFIGGFSISGGENGCQFLMSGEDAWRLTYNTGMYLSETLYEIKKRK